jgi:hypothetical protein
MTAIGKAILTLLRSADRELSVVDEFLFTNKARAKGANLLITAAADLVSAWLNNPMNYKKVMEEVVEYLLKEINRK